MNATLSPLDYVLTLAEQEQEKLFLAMIRMMADNNPDRGAIPLWDGNALLGFFVHPNSPEAELISPAKGPSPEFLEMLRQMPPKMAEQLLRPIPHDLDLDDVISDEDIKTIREEVS